MEKPTVGQEVQVLKAELEEVLLKLSKLAPLRFHDTDCDNLLFCYRRLHYDELREEIHVDMSMWHDSMKQLQGFKQYHIIYATQDDDVYLVEGANYEYKAVGNYNNGPDHHDAIHCNIVAVANKMEVKSVDTLSYDWKDYTICYAMSSKYTIEAETVESAVEQFKQLAIKRGWLKNGKDSED